MSIFLGTYLLCLCIMLVIDSAWLFSMIDFLYRKNIGHLMTAHLVWPAAVIFYLLYAFGVTIFIIMPAVQQSQKSLLEIFAYGALFGLVAYGTYDLTNHAVLRDWPLIVTVADMAWGALLTGSTSLLTVYIFRFFR